MTYLDFFPKMQPFPAIQGFVVEVVRPFQRKNANETN
jgi:hypothetical protein